MTLSDNERVKLIEAKLEDAMRQIADLVRRVDDLSKAERARTERENQRVKKSA